MAVIIPWFPDTSDEEHAEAAKWIEILWHMDAGLGEAVARLPWVLDGINTQGASTEGLFVDEAQALSDIASTAGVNPSLARSAVNREWIADGLTAGEASLISFVADYATQYPDAAESVLSIPSIAGGAIEDLDVLHNLIAIGGNAPELTRTALDHARQQEGDLSGYLLSSLATTSSTPGALQHLAAQPWFADGLTADEAAFVVAVTNLPSDGGPYRAMLQEYFSQYGTVDLPLRGTVKIWAFQGAPFQPGEDLITPIAETVTLMEELLGIAFPTDHVILLVADFIDSTRAGVHLGGVHTGSSMRAFGPPARLSTVIHETAHYYFTFPPDWLTEGGADSTVAYVKDRMGIQSLAQRGVELDQLHCNERNLLHYSYHANFFGWTCAYPLGERFLLRLAETIGGENVWRALGELYVLHERGLLAGSDTAREAIYDALLRNTPQELRGAFTGAFDRLHGRIPDAERDDHGNSTANATDLSVGQTIEGVLDYRFDFDFFRLPARQGERYRVQMRHQYLRDDSVWAYHADEPGAIGHPMGLAEWDARIWARQDSPTGPQLFLTPPGNGYYYVSVENFAGESGPYTITLTLVE